VARSRRRARRGLRGFLLLVTVVVTASLVGLVSLQAILAQSSFRTAELQTRIGDLADRHGVLTSEVARLSAPGRVAAWAEAHGMRAADVGHIVIVTVPSDDASRSSGEGPGGRLASLVKPILGSAG
jgi:cell division protein FtsL